MIAADGKIHGGMLFKNLLLAERTAEEWDAGRSLRDHFNNL